MGYHCFWKHPNGKNMGCGFLLRGFREYWYYHKFPALGRKVPLAKSIYCAEALWFFPRCIAEGKGQAQKKNKRNARSVHQSILILPLKNNVWLHFLHQTQFLFFPSGILAIYLIGPVISWKHIWCRQVSVGRVRTHFHWEGASQFLQPYQLDKQLPADLFFVFGNSKTSVVSTQLKDISQNGNLFFSTSVAAGMKIKNIWNHHLENQLNNLLPEKWNPKITNLLCKMGPKKRL